MHGVTYRGPVITTGFYKTVLFAIWGWLYLVNNNNNNNNNNNLFFHQSSRYIKVWLKLHEYIFNSAQLFRTSFAVLG
jgi:hypothetical protein